MKLLRLAAGTFLLLTLVAPLGPSGEAAEQLLLPGLTVENHYVEYIDSWIESDPVDQVAFFGKLKVHPPDPADSMAPRELISEDWGDGQPPDKPPYLTTYTLYAKAHGLGQVRLMLEGLARSGGSTSTHDVGDFRSPDRNPNDPDQALSEKMANLKKNWFWHKHVEAHLVIHSYADGYRASRLDTCIPVKNKGTEFETMPGTEDLKASGKVRGCYIKVTSGKQKTVHEQFSITASSTPSASVGWGASDTVAWHWSIEQENTWETPAPPLEGSFSVGTHVKQEGSGSGAAGPDVAGCVQCENCGTWVHKPDDHSRGKCPVDGTAPGCGKEVWQCDDGQRRLHDEWHKERVCDVLANVVVFDHDLGYSYLTVVNCGSPFRHCSNPLSHAIREFKDSDWEPTDPHSDGSVPISPYEDEDGNDASAAPATGLSSSDSSYTARAGGTHQANLVADGPYSQVYWYVKAPGDTSSYGTQVEIDNGDGSTSEASLSYTFPSGVTGEHTITAYIYRSDLSVYEESYTVTVESVIGNTGH